jgi:hypothetical protein
MNKFETKIPPPATKNDHNQVPVQSYSKPTFYTSICSMSMFSDIISEELLSYISCTCNWWPNKVSNSLNQK